ncbi:MAG: MarR family transcriptional regulator [Candidatus Limnocylindrales bacterium]|jgi:DNA-binding MarR family transcriptional regulator
MSEVSTRQLEIEAVIDALVGMWDPNASELPAWVEQELTFGQMRLLFLLSKHGPSPMSRIAEWLGVGLPTVSGAVERVERHGLVERRHRLDDRRVVDCHLTDAGRGLIDEISGMRLEMMRRFLGVLNDEELVEMARLVNIVLERAKASMV